MYIHQLNTFLPEYSYTQESLLDWMLEYLQPNERDSRVMSMVYRRSMVNQRHSVLPDFGLDGSLLFANRSNPLVEERMALYSQEGEKLLKQLDLSVQDSSEVTDVIFVSCTGMAAPGMDITLIKSLGLNSSVNRLSIHYMGCYAFVTALRQAKHICKSKLTAKVLVVSLELCTLHLQQNVSYDAIASAALFADGMAVALIGSEPKRSDDWYIGESFSALHEHSEDKMSWDITSHGFKMGLNQDVPDLIEQVCSSLERPDHYDWAIHPGGRKILESFESGAGVSREQLQYSYEVMRDAGNMSSATIAFVLEKTMAGTQKTEFKH